MSCTKSNCPFTHATACRYGSDCHLPGCHFAHFSKDNSTSLQSSQEVQVSVDEDKDEKSEHMEELQNNTAQPANNENNTNNTVASPNDDVNMNNDVNLEERDMKIEGEWLDLTQNFSLVLTLV